MQKGEGRCLEKIKWEERDDDEDVGTVDDVNDMGYFIIVEWSRRPRHLDIRPIVTHCIDACPGNDDDGDDDGDDDDDDDDDGDDDTCHRQAADEMQSCSASLVLKYMQVTP